VTHSRIFDEFNGFVFVTNPRGLGNLHCVHYQVKTQQLWILVGSVKLDGDNFQPLWRSSPPSVPNTVGSITFVFHLLMEVKWAFQKLRIW